MISACKYDFNSEEVIAVLKYFNFKYFKFQNDEFVSVQKYINGYIKCNNYLTIKL